MGPGPAQVASLGSIERIVLGVSHLAARPNPGVFQFSGLWMEQVKHLLSLGFCCGVVPCAALLGCAGSIDGEQYRDDPVSDSVAPAADSTSAPAAMNDEPPAPVDDEPMPMEDPPLDASEETPATMPAPGPVPCDAVTNVFQQDCSGYGCHSGTTFGNFAVSEAAAETFVGRLPVVNTYPGCGTIIDPDNPLDSLILRKVLGVYSGNTACGAQMPLGSPMMLSNEKIACIRSWLRQFQR